MEVVGRNGFRSCHEDWTERTGRVLGVLWIAVGLSYYAYYLWEEFQFWKGSSWGVPGMMS